MGKAEYVRMNLRVTREARDAWDAFAAENAATSSALAEAIGRLVLAQGKPLSAAVVEARAVTQARLRRRD